MAYSPPDPAHPLRKQVDTINTTTADIKNPVAINPNAVDGRNNSITSNSKALEDHATTKPPLSAQSKQLAPSGPPVSADIIKASSAPVSEKQKPSVTQPKLSGPSGSDKISESQILKPKEPVEKSEPKKLEKLESVKTEAPSTKTEQKPAKTQPNDSVEKIKKSLESSNSKFKQPESKPDDNIKPSTDRESNSVKKNESTDSIKIQHKTIDALQVQEKIRKSISQDTFTELNPEQSGQSFNDQLSDRKHKLSPSSLTIFPETVKKLKKDARYQAEIAKRPAIHSFDLVSDEKNSYLPCNLLLNYSRLTFTLVEKNTNQEIDWVELEYPGIDQDCTEKYYKAFLEILTVLDRFALALPKSIDDYSPIHDLYTTAQHIAQECLDSSAAGSLGDTKTGALRQIIKYCNRKLANELKSAVSDFNQLVKDLKSKSQVTTELDGPPVSHELAVHILEQSYARCVAPKSHILRDYEGFSNNVYGEIKPNFVRELIKNSHLKTGDIFLDMGSGTGNVVLQVAAECLVESYGIEIMENPATLAKKQRTEFLSRMRYYGKPCGRIYLKQGDFLAEDSIQKVIAKADVIFVNKQVYSW